MNKRGSVSARNGIRPLYGGSLGEIRDALNRRSDELCGTSAHFSTIVAEALKVPAFVWHAAFQGFVETSDFTARSRTYRCRHCWRGVIVTTYALRAAQDRLLQAIPGARLVVYEDHGHAFHWEDPARFAAHLVAFLVHDQRLQAVLGKNQTR